MSERASHNEARKVVLIFLSRHKNKWVPVEKIINYLEKQTIEWGANSIVSPEEALRNNVTGMLWKQGHPIILRRHFLEGRDTYKLLDTSKPSGVITFCFEEKKYEIPEGNGSEILKLPDGRFLRVLDWIQDSETLCIAPKEVELVDPSEATEKC